MLFSFVLSMVCEVGRPDLSKGYAIDTKRCVFLGAGGGNVP